MFDRSRHLISKSEAINLSKTADLSEKVDYCNVKKTFFIM